METILETCIKCRQMTLEAEDLECKIRNTGQVRAVKYDKRPGDQPQMEDKTMKALNRKEYLQNKLDQLLPQLNVFQAVACTGLLKIINQREFSFKLSRQEVYEICCLYWREAMEPKEIAASVDQPQRIVSRALKAVDKRLKEDHDYRTFTGLPYTADPADPQYSEKVKAWKQQADPESLDLLASEKALGGNFQKA